MNGILEVERRDKLSDIGCIGVHLVAAVGLVRPPVAPAVVGDHAISFRQEKHHLIVPIIGTQWPTMVEHDRLSFSRTPILVEDPGPVFGGDVSPWMRSLVRGPAGRTDAAVVIGLVRARKR